MSRKAGTARHAAKRHRLPAGVHTLWAAAVAPDLVDHGLTRRTCQRKGLSVSSMDENPYKAPQEESLDPPESSDFGRTLRRLAIGNFPRWLVVTMLVVIAVCLLIVNLVQR
jgi:hypothetical protein